MAELRLRPAAVSDLETIFATGRADWGAARAEDCLSTLLDKLDLLAGFPELARLRPEIAPPVRIHPHGVHLVVYDAVPGGIEVVRILHQRQDWAAYLAD